MFVKGYTIYLITREDKATSKVRIVYGFEGDNVSLNQCLHVGPSYNQFIMDILVRFRIYPVALVGDIEKAFLMINVNRRDRCSKILMV